VFVGAGVVAVGVAAELGGAGLLVGVGVAFVEPEFAAGGAVVAGDVKSEDFGASVAAGAGSVA
jgi:hypothetical protein